MHTQGNRAISGHIHMRTGERGSVWYAKYRGPVRQQDGNVTLKQVEKKIGPLWTGNGRPVEGTFTKKTAQTWLDAKLTDLRRGVGIPTAATATFADAAAEWYRWGCNERAWKPATRRDYRSALRAHLGVALDKEGRLVETRTPFGDLPLAEITTHTIEQWRRDAMADGTLPRRTAVKIVAILHGIFTRARKPPYNLTSNPAADVEPLKTTYDSGRFDFYGIEEVLALVRAAEIPKGDEPTAEAVAAAKQDAGIYLTAALTGLRMGEVLALRVRDVDFENDTIRVVQSLDPIEGIGTPKSGKGRSVPMVPQVSTALARLLNRQQFTEHDDLVFPNEIGRWLDSSALRRRYRAAQKGAKLRPIRFHDLRHTFGTHGRASAESDRELQEWMGHADARTTARYTHYRPRRDAANRLARAFTVESVEGANSERVEKEGTA